MISKPTKWQYNRKIMDSLCPLLLSSIACHLYRHSIQVKDPSNASIYLMSLCSVGNVSHGCEECPQCDGWDSCRQSILFGWLWARTDDTDDTDNTCAHPTHRALRTTATHSHCLWPFTQTYCHILNRKPTEHWSSGKRSSHIKMR